MMFPARLIFLAPPMVVEGKQNPALTLGDPTKVNRRFSAVAADLEIRARHGYRLRGFRQGHAFIRRHEATRRLGVTEEFGVEAHVVADGSDRHITLSRMTYFATHTTPNAPRLVAINTSG